MPRRRAAGFRFASLPRIGTYTTAAALALSGGVAAPAGAAVDTATGIADDAQMLYEGAAAAERAAAAFKAMGVDTVRLHARWAFIAPRPVDRLRPAGFRGRNHEDPGYNWSLLDRAIGLLEANGIRPLVAITGSGPVWSSRNPALDNPRYKPDPRLFGDFARAVATRYKGRVSRYLVWNEPNQAGWLQPQFRCRGTVCTPLAPHLYRELYRAASDAVRSVDPSAEVLIGSLAPRGQAPRRANATMRPLQFIRTLGCVKTSYRPDRTGPCRTAKPVTAFGFSYHPHPVSLAPDERDPQRDNAALGDTKRLEKALDRTVLGGILTPTTGKRFNLYFTEFGYQTNPPDESIGIPTARQAAYIQWATYLAWRDPRVRLITQYEWIDEPLKTASRTLDPFAGWQSGMLFVDRRPKPLAKAFPNPFYVDVLPRGRARFWGQVRPGGVAQIALQQFGDGAWTTIHQQFTNTHGYWTTDRALPAAGRFRFVYRLPSAEPGRLPRTVVSLSQKVRPQR